MLRLGVLGPLVAEIDGVRIDLGGRRQRAVLARLTVARGEVVGIDRLIDDVWEASPPRGAVASLQSYVSHLRRALEPGRRPRARTEVVARATPGYRLALPAEAVDAEVFAHELARARALLDAAPGDAANLLATGLARWRGPALADFADMAWAEIEVARLTELRLLALETQARAQLAAGDPGSAGLVAEQLTRADPLREAGWQLLARARWAAGQSVQALAALHRARTVLTAELAVSPGPELLALEGAIARGASSPQAPQNHPAPAPAWSEVNDPFVGRRTELAAVRAAGHRSRQGCRELVLVTGEAGSGKSRLLARWRSLQDPGTWTFLTGSGSSGPGTPAAWAWAQALRSLAEQIPPDPALVPHLAALMDEDPWPKPDGDPDAIRFRAHEAVARWLRTAARRRPLAIVLDDLQGADDETWSLLVSLVERLVDSPVLFLVARQPDDQDRRAPGLWAALARHHPVRVELTGLAPDDVEHLVVRLVTAAGADRPSPTTLTAVAERTAGHPFTVREIAALLIAEGERAAMTQVPRGVRDLLRRRLSRLPDDVTALVCQAAVLGEHLEVEVLLTAVGGDPEAAGQALDAAVVSGLLLIDGPGRLRFSHALLRDTVEKDLSVLDRQRLHGRAGSAWEHHGPSDPSLLAHHFAQSGTARWAERAVDYSLRAADAAARRYARDTEIALLEQAVACGERLPPTTGQDRETLRITVLTRLLRAQLLSGRLAEARLTRDRALDRVRSLARDDLLLEVFAAWSTPTALPTRSYHTVDVQVVTELERLLRPGAAPGISLTRRCQLLACLGTELDQHDPRTLDAVRELGKLAPEQPDPVVRGTALILRLRMLLADPDQRAMMQVSTDLADLDHSHDLPGHRWSSHLAGASAAGMANDPDLMAEHLGQALAVATAFQLSAPRALTVMGLGALALARGRFPEAEQFARQAAEGLEGSGSPESDGLGVLLLATQQLARGRLGDLYPVLAAPRFRDVPGIDDLLVLARVAAGDRGGAAADRPLPQPLRPDALFPVVATLRAMALVALADPRATRAEARQVSTALAPWSGQVAGAGLTVMMLRPVAQSLGELNLLLGARGQARRHFAQALEVARSWGNPRWIEQARTALRHGD